MLGPSGLKIHKRAGRVDDLVATLPKRLKGPVGIGHTRWATHGEPTDGNAHPHTDASGHVAVVHNGIVENAAELRAKLAAEGIDMASDTDTEVIAQLVGLRAADQPLEDAVREALSMVVGTYGLAVVDDRQPDRIVVARNGSPVVLGVGRRAHYLASDVSALVRHTDQVVHLDDHEMAVLHADAYRTFTLDARPTDKAPATTDGRPPPPSTWPVTPTTCTRRCTSSPSPSPRRCGAGSTGASPPPTSAGWTCRPATCWACGG